MVPVYVGGVVTLAGVGVAIAMAAFKQTALDNANTTFANIKAHGSSCPPPAGTSDTALVHNCSVFADDNDSVNQDATAANVAVGIAVAGLVGTVAYWIFADKSTGEAHRTGQLTVVPIAGPGTGGLAFAGRF
jgi:hypothetical protein